ncbi:MAG: hypothetical protein KGS48_12420 [Bacteroidetes bacterium]|nr:hypothetical protein [Bacteroidota bacterium]
MFSNTISALRVTGVHKRGSSRPIIVQDASGAAYLVKLRASLSNPHAQLVDFIACLMGQALQLPVMPACLVNLQIGMDMQAVDVETREAIQKSIGLNLAYPFFQNAEDLPGELLKGNTLLIPLFLFDCLLLNIDRTPANTNVLRAEGTLYAFDFEASMRIQGAIIDQNFQDSPMVLQQLRRSPLWQAEIAKEEITAFFQRFEGFDPDQILLQIPEIWFENTAQLQRLSAFFQALPDQADALNHLIQHMSALPPVSEKELRDRAQENQKKFTEQYAEDLRLRIEMQNKKWK